MLHRLLYRPRLKFWTDFSLLFVCFIFGSLARCSHFKVDNLKILVERRSLFALALSKCPGAIQTLSRVVSLAPGPS